MKTEILIQQGRAKIVLQAENEFERDLIEKVADHRDGYKTETDVLTDYGYYNHTNHRIEISLIKKES